MGIDLFNVLGQEAKLWDAFWIDLRFVAKRDRFESVNRFTRLVHALNVLLETSRRRRHTKFTVAVYLNRCPHNSCLANASDICGRMPGQKVPFNGRIDWRNRLAQLRLRECEQVVAAKQEARQRVAEITELERASVARRVFDTASEFIDHARNIAKKPPQRAARLLDIGVSVAAQVGGVARGYATPKIKVVVHEDEQSRKAKKLEDEFFDAHPELKRPPDILKLWNATIVDENGVARSANDDDKKI